MILVKIVQPEKKSTFGTEKKIHNLEREKRFPV
jgi:hypothetical protein